MKRYTTPKVQVIEEIRLSDIIATSPGLGDETDDEVLDGGAARMRRHSFADD